MELKEHVVSTKDIKNLLEKWMQKHGIDWDNDDNEPREDKEGEIVPTPATRNREQRQRAHFAKLV